MRQWTEPLKVQNYGDGCVASANFLAQWGNTSENCLFVNIFVPGEFHSVFKIIFLKYFFQGYEFFHLNSIFNVFTIEIYCQSFFNRRLLYSKAGGAAKKTVLIFIHGGCFTEGTSNDVFYGPDFLIDADNILVTFNYRVGIFGFLTLGSGEYTGNMGLKDQQLALKWIYANIEHFSGKPNEILLFGHSAGKIFD